MPHAGCLVDWETQTTIVNYMLHVESSTCYDDVRAAKSHTCGISQSSSVGEEKAVEKEGSTNGDAEVLMAFSTDVAGLVTAVPAVPCNHNTKTLAMKVLECNSYMSDQG